MYVPVKGKFWSAVLVAILWTLFGKWVSEEWLVDLTGVFGEAFATYIVLTIAVIPGFLTAFFSTSLWFDARPPLQTRFASNPISVIVASFNEEAGIRRTIDSIKEQIYYGEIEIIVVNDGSRDNTSAVLNTVQGIKVIDFIANKGKYNALNAGLLYASHDLVVSVDSDCVLEPNAINNLVERFNEDPGRTAAVAGSMMALNWATNFITRVQYLDYFFGISVTKRVQSLYQATSVAQGAFSLYRKDVLQKLGGWKRGIGEDIILTWEMIADGYRVGHAENAYAYTIVPEHVWQLIKQRKRWAIGFFEALRHAPRIALCNNYFYATLIFNLMFVLVDFSYIFILIPGIFLALTGNFLLAGPMLLLVAALGMMLNYLMFVVNGRTLKDMGTAFPRIGVGPFLFYFLVYSFLIQISSVSGYLSLLVASKKTWGTRC